MPSSATLASQHIMVWSADFPADDWTKISPAQVYQRAMQRIEANHRGILLLHDIQPRTVEALPYILRDLKRRGYHIVHVVPATADMPETASLPSQWIMHARQIWPQVPIFAEIEPELPAPSPASFGGSNLYDTRSLVHGPAHHPRMMVAVHGPHGKIRYEARGPVPLPPVSLWPRDDGSRLASPGSFRPLLPARARRASATPTTPRRRGSNARRRSTWCRRPPAPPPNPPRMLLDSHTDVTGSVLPALRGPITAATLPRGAFP